MQQDSRSDFDFDDWAGLYMENPEEFEARRQAVLMIELARGTPEQAAKGRALLDAYEKAAKGRTPLERAALAGSMMMDSAQELNVELMMLKDSLEKLDSKTG
jgi:hypothetical protein